MRRLVLILAAVCLALALGNFSLSKTRAQNLHVIVANPQLYISSENFKEKNSLQDLYGKLLVPGDRVSLAIPSVDAASESSWKIFSVDESQRTLPLDSVLSHLENQKPISSSLELLQLDSMTRSLVFANKAVENLPSAPNKETFTIFPVIPQDVHGFELRSFSLPERVRQGRPFLFRWSVFSIHPVEGKIEVWFEDEKLAEEKFNSDELFQGSLRLTANHSGKGSIRLKAIEGLAPNRPKEILGDLEVLPPPKIGMVGEVGPVSDWLEKQGYIVESNTELASSVDALVVAAPVQEAKTVLDFIREGGGVLWMSRETFPSPPAPELAEALPVIFKEAPPPSESAKPKPVDIPSENPTPTPPEAQPDPLTDPRKEKREAGTIALVLIVDKSGSMAGEKLQKAQESAIATAKTLGDDDSLAVFAFDHRMQELIPMQKLKEIKNLRQDLEKLEAGGGTRLFPALKKSVEVLLSTPASIRHVIVLTDGATDDAVQAPYFEFTAACVRQGITITTIGIRGVEYDTDFLSNLALWGKGRFYPADSDKLPQVFTAETHRVKADLERKKPQKPAPPPPKKEPEKKPAPKPETPPPTSFTIEARDTHPSLKGLEFTTAVTVSSYLPSIVRPGSIVPLVLQENSDPLLVTRLFGKGKMAVWTSDAGKGWTVSFFKDPRAQKLFVQLIEYLRRDESEERSTWVLKNETGFSYPDEEGLRLWALGSDPKNRLRSHEEHLRDLAAFAATKNAKLLNNLSEIPSSVQRQNLSESESYSYIFAIAAGVLLIVEMFLKTRR